jgi:hypothetical protein
MKSTFIIDDCIDCSTAVSSFLTTIKFKIIKTTTKKRLDKDGKCSKTYRRKVLFARMCYLDGHVCHKDMQICYQYDMMLGTGLVLFTGFATQRFH